MDTAQMQPFGRHDEAYNLIWTCSKTWTGKLHYEVEQSIKIKITTDEQEKGKSVKMKLLIQLSVNNEDK